MIIYNVSVNINKSAADDWLQWMKQVHIPDVLATKMFFDFKICRLLGQDDEEGNPTFVIQYYAENMADYNRYHLEFAPSLQAQHEARYHNQFVAFRTMMETV